MFVLIFDEIRKNIRKQRLHHIGVVRRILIFLGNCEIVFKTRKSIAYLFFVGTNPHLFEMPKIHEIDNPVYLFAPKTFIPMLTQAETVGKTTRLGSLWAWISRQALHLTYIGGSGVTVLHSTAAVVKFHKRMSTSRPRTVSINACNEAERVCSLLSRVYE